MFDIFRSVKRIFSLKQKDPVNVQEIQDTQNTPLGNKLERISNFLKHRFAYVIVEYRIIKEKMQNLSQSNYNLGMRYLDGGNIKEAIFRFRIIKKFWPNHHEAHYQLVYCLLLEQEIAEAKKNAKTLLKKAPQYQEKIKALFLPQKL